MTPQHNAARPMTLFAFSKDQQDAALMDPWTVVHFSAGLMAGLLDISAGWTFTISTLHELIELRPAAMKFFKSTPESPGNVIIDMAVVMGGWWLGHKYNQSATSKRAALEQSTRGHNPHVLPQVRSLR